MMIAITHAKIGRSMKNCAMARPQVGFDAAALAAAAPLTGAAPLAGALAPGPVPGTAREEPSALRGLSVLVTAGGTREPLDSVRFLGNRSSGRMGVAVAAEAHRRGAVVTMLAANLTVPAPDSIDVIACSTAADLLKWDMALYTNKLVKQSTLQEAFTPMKLKDGSSSNYGFGWSLRSDSVMGKIVLHTGDNPGYKTQIIRFTDQQKTIILLNNNAHGNFESIIKATEAYLKSHSRVL